MSAPPRYTSFQDIKASFEAKISGTTQHHHHHHRHHNSKPHTSADGASSPPQQSNVPPTQRLITPLIPTVASPPAAPPVAPPTTPPPKSTVQSFINKLNPLHYLLNSESSATHSPAVEVPPIKPSTPSPEAPPNKLDNLWIGPLPGLLPGLLNSHAMKHTVRISYASPGLQPPVYVLTSLSDPQWAPIEMDIGKEDGGEHIFGRTFEAEEGEHQYKFRLGPGDWWVHDTSKPTVDDGFGNRNNVILVKAIHAPPHRADSPVADESLAPLLKHETFVEPETINEDANEAEEEEEDDDLSQDQEEEEDGDDAESDQGGPPLMKHETFIEPEPTKEETTEAEAEADDPSQSEEDADVEDEEGDREGPPLFRHESLGPDSAEEEQAPLFRHETTVVGTHDVDLHPTSSHSSDSTPAVPEEAKDSDEADLALARFPTDSDGIMLSLERVSTHLREDRSIPGDTVLSSRAVSSGSSVEPTPPILEELEEDEEDDGEGEIVEAEIIVAEVRPAEPMTPPMTPTEVKHTETIYQDAETPDQNDNDEPEHYGVAAEADEETPLIARAAETSEPVASSPPAKHREDKRPGPLVVLWQMILRCVGFNGSAKSAVLLAAAIGIGAAAFAWYRKVAGS